MVMSPISTRRTNSLMKSLQGSIINTQPTSGKASSEARRCKLWSAVLWCYNINERQFLLSVEGVRRYFGIRRSKLVCKISWFTHDVHLNKYWRPTGWMAERRVDSKNRSFTTISHETKKVDCSITKENLSADHASHYHFVTNNLESNSAQTQPDGNPRSL